MYVSMYRWMDGWMYACIHGHVWWCMITYDDVSVWLCMINYDYMHVDMEVWMCGCMYHYVAMYTHYIILKIDYNPCIEYSPRRCSSCCMSHLRHPVGMSRVYSSYASRMTFKWRFPKIGVPPKIIGYPHWWKPPNNGLSPHVFWEAHLTTKALQATRCTAARADGFCLSAATIEISVLKQLHLGLCQNGRQWGKWWVSRRVVLPNHQKPVQILIVIDYWLPNIWNRSRPEVKISLLPCWLIPRAGIGRGCHLTRQDKSCSMA